MQLGRPEERYGEPWKRNVWREMDGRALGGKANASIQSLELHVLVAALAVQDLDLLEFVVKGKSGMGDLLGIVSIPVLLVLVFGFSGCLTGGRLIGRQPLDVTELLENRSAVALCNIVECLRQSICVSEAEARPLRSVWRLLCFA